MSIRRLLEALTHHLSTLILLNIAPSIAPPMPTTFASFSTPPSSALYSTAFFNRLSFCEVQTLFVPPLLPPGCLRSFVWSSKILTHPARCQINSSDIVPSSDDLRAIMKEMSSQFALGARSIDVMFDLPSGSTFVASYSFQKVIFFFMLFVFV